MVQLVTGSPWLVTATVPWNPPGHWLATVYVAVQPVLAALATVVITIALPAARTATAAAIDHALGLFIDSPRNCGVPTDLVTVSS